MQDEVGKRNDFHSEAAPRQPHHRGPSLMPSTPKSPRTPQSSSSIDLGDSKSPPPWRCALFDERKATIALVIAAGEGNVEALQQLLDECMLVDHTSVTTDDCKPVQADLARPDDGLTALVAACEGGHNECVKLLLQRGATPGKSTKSGLTPVMAACYRGHSDCLRQCLAAGACAYSGLLADKNGHKRSPIILALERLGTTGEDACATLLLQYDSERLGATASAEQRAAAASYYSEALVTSCASGRTACVELLLRGRVDPDAPAMLHDKGIYPLQAAVSSCCPSCVKALLHHGATPRLQISFGKPPLEMALDQAGESEECAECAALLQAHIRASDLVGQLVMLVDLQAKSFNGRYAIAERHDCQRERLEVRLLAPRTGNPFEDPLRQSEAKAPLLLKPGNLEPVGSAAAYLADHQRRATRLKLVLASLVVGMLAILAAVVLQVYTGERRSLSMLGLGLDKTLESIAHTVEALWQTNHSYLYGAPPIEEVTPARRRR